jgi:hypothetical protein
MEENLTTRIMTSFVLCRHRDTRLRCLISTFTQLRFPFHTRFLAEGKSTQKIDVDHLESLLAVRSTTTIVVVVVIPVSSPLFRFTSST